MDAQDTQTWCVVCAMMAASLCLDHMTGVLRCGVVCCAVVCCGVLCAVLCIAYFLLSPCSTVIVWDIETGRVLHRMAVHHTRVFRVDLDATRLISCSQSGNITTLLYDDGTLRPRAVDHVTTV